MFAFSLFRCALQIFKRSCRDILAASTFNDVKIQAHA